MKEVSLYGIERWGDKDVDGSREICLFLLRVNDALLLNIALQYLIRGASLQVTRRMQIANINNESFEQESKRGRGSKKDKLEAIRY